MNKKIRWITETAVMLALLITLQALTKPLGQLVTGSCVNAVLAVAALVGGLSSGITIALISPVMAYLLNIAPQVLTVPAIMVGNTVYVAILCLLADEKGEHMFAHVVAWILAAFSKFCVLYSIVKWIICGLLAPALLGAGLMKEPMLKALPITFGLPQLFTALIGGGVALLIWPVLRKALRK